MIDIEKLLADVAEEPPCGPNLEYDAEFLALEQVSQGKPEQQFGDTIIPAEQPEWRAVREQALALFARTKDLRVAVSLTRALVSSGGLAGLNAGLKLIHQMLEKFWDHVHPQLDVEDGNDPTMRLNSLGPLVDAEGLIREMRHSAFVQAKGLGQILVRDVEVALGKLPAPAEGAPYTLDQIESLLRGIAAEDPTQVAVVREAEQTVRALYKLLSDKVGSDRAIDLRPLINSLHGLVQLCDRVVGVPGDVAAAEEGSEAGAAGGAAAGGALQVTGDIRSRDDALRLLDKVCDYLERHEPSNPAPLLIKRAKRLMTMSFVDILRDMAPESIPNVESIAGIKAD